MSSIPDPAWGLIGVLLGFFLGEGYRLIREWCSIFRLKKVIEAELRSVRAQIKSKENILRQAIQACETGRILPMISVRSVRTGYDAYLDDLYKVYTELERNCLHVIYERSRISDEVMDSFEKDFQESLKVGIIDEPWDTAIGKLDGLLQSYDVIDGLIQSFLDGTPTDVFPQLASGNTHDQPSDDIGTIQGQ